MKKVCIIVKDEEQLNKVKSNIDLNIGIPVEILIDNEENRHIIDSLREPEIQEPTKEDVMRLCEDTIKLHERNLEKMGNYLYNNHKSNVPFYSHFYKKRK